MVTTRKRQLRDSIETLPANAESSTKKRSTKVKRSNPDAAQGSKGIVELWQHGVPVADLDGDSIDPDWIPPRLKASNISSISTPYLLRTGTSYDAGNVSRLPFGGSAHALAQSLGSRVSSTDLRIKKTQFRYRQSLPGHSDCINALALSRDQGRWLASAGDDKEIHIRDMLVDLRNNNQTVPLAILKGHESNIFSLDWSAQNRYLFSTGNDSQILYYDVEHSSLPVRGPIFTEPQTRSPFNPHPLGAHDDSVPELSAHPTNPNLLLSCDDGGNLKLIDIRIPHHGVASARSDAISGFSSVQWNPNSSDGNTFAAATCGRITGSTRLYDVRQCFSADDTRPLTSKDAVLSYHTALMQNSSKRGLIAASAETNSLCFDPEGRFLASSISRYHPTIYAVNDPDPLATLESTVADDIVEEGYYRFRGVPRGTPAAPKKLSSCCTIKHGSFGLEAQTGKLHYAIGSDDFRAYVFEIPSKDELLRQREFVNRNEWLCETSRLHSERQSSAQAASQAESQTRCSGQHNDEDQAEDANDEDDSDDGMVSESHVDPDSEIAYCAGSMLRAENIVRPARITQQSYVLCGGRSIINTTLIHPTLPLILTAGIVSEITVHSAAPLSSIDVRPKCEEWLEDHPDHDKIGGTRPRFLLPPSAESLLDQDSEFSEDYYDEEEVENDDDQSNDRSDMVEERGGPEDDNEPEIEVSNEDASANSGTNADAQADAAEARGAPVDESPPEIGGSSSSPNNIDPSSAGAEQVHNHSASSEALLNGPASTTSNESQAPGQDSLDNTLPAQDAAARASHRRSTQSDSEESMEASGDDEAYSPAEGDETGSVENEEDEQATGAGNGAREAGAGSEHEVEQSTVQIHTHSTVEDFLTAMRNDPMYSTPAPLDYHHDRHIGTYSLSHLPSHLIPSDSEEEDEDQDFDGEGSSDQEESSSEDEQDTASPSEEDCDLLDYDNQWDVLDNEERDEYANDGYGASWESDEDIWDKMEEDEMNNFQEQNYSADDGKMWALCRNLGASHREQRRMQLFDELLRRDELRSLTAGFKKVPKTAGGKADGSGFTCGSCHRNINVDP